MGVDVRPMEDDDREPAFPIFAEAFGADPATLESSLGLPVQDRWVVTTDGRIDGLLRVLRVGHFFGGRPVSSCGLAAVAIAAPRRGRGLGVTLVREVLRALRAEGVAMSTLYPATMAPYRRVGYEAAGSRIRYAAPLAELPVRASELEVAAFGDDDLPSVVECYRAFAETRPGLMDRPDWYWAPRVLNAPDNQFLYRYLVRDDQRVRGYMVYTHHHEPGGGVPAQYAPGDETSWALATRDFVWLDIDAALAMLRFAAGHASMLGTRLVWTGPPYEPLTTLFSGAEPQIVSAFRWLARLLDVPAAFEARGYPPGLEASVDIRVTGDALAGEDACFRIEVADGAGNATPTGTAATTLDIGALSALFTGMSSVAELRGLGRLESSDPALESLAAALRAGGSPWSFDFF